MNEIIRCYLKKGSNEPFLSYGCKRFDWYVNSTIVHVEQVWDVYSIPNSFSLFHLINQTLVNLLIRFLTKEPQTYIDFTFRKLKYSYENVTMAEVLFQNLNLPFSLPCVIC